MKKARRFSKILLYQSLGFLAIIVVCWVDALFDVQAWILQDHSGWAGSILGCFLQTLLVLTVWFLVAASTRRVWDRLERLEGFLRVCSWCRQIDYKGHWMPIEDFLSQSFDTPTTHGICEKCLEEQMTAVKSAQRGQVPNSKSASASP